MTKATPYKGGARHTGYVDFVEANRDLLQFLWGFIWNYQGFDRCSYVYFPNEYTYV